jgi:hypothetical protein
MMKGAWWLLLLLCACKTIAPQKRHEAKQKAILHDSLRIHLMRVESAAYGDFVGIRRFHSDLLQEIDSLREPYIELDVVFRNMHEMADSVIIQRLHFDSAQFVVADQLIANANYYMVEYRHEAARYDQIRQTHGVQRYSYRQYAEIIEAKIESWNDSLESSGHWMAQCKNHLKASSLVHGSKEYIAAYQPISQLELSIKQMQSTLMQLHNTESRFKEANVEEFYYTGPHLRRRKEIAASEQIVSELALHMSDIHQWKKLYFAQF